MSYMSKHIPLTKGRVATVDDGDFDALSKYRWCVQSNRYAATRTKDGLVLMHRMIMRAKKGEEVDHRNGDGFDNQRSNLRLCTHQQNVWNTPRSHKYGYRGVTRDKKRFIAQIRGDGWNWRSGPYDTPALAALAYNVEAQQRFGEFAILNEVPSSELTEEYRQSFVRQQYANVIMAGRNTSGVRGAWYHKKNKVWCAEIRYQDTGIKLCTTPDKDEAGYIYDQAAYQLHGDRARLNTPFD